MRKNKRWLIIKEIDELESAIKSLEIMNPDDTDLVFLKAKYSKLKLIEGKSFPLGFKSRLRFEIWRIKVFLHELSKIIKWYKESGRL